MAEHAWTVLCQKTMADTDTKLLSLVDLFDKLIINPTPEIPDIAAKLEEVREAGGLGLTVPTELRIVTQWYRSDLSLPESAKCRLLLVDPSGARIFDQEVSIELTEKPLQRITVRSHQIGVTQLGLYWLVVEKPGKGKRTTWTEVTRLPLYIEVRGVA